MVLPFILLSLIACILMHNVRHKMDHGAFAPFREMLVAHSLPLQLLTVLSRLRLTRFALTSRTVFFWRPGWLGCTGERSEDCKNGNSAP